MGPSNFDVNYLRFQHVFMPFNEFYDPRLMTNVIQRLDK